MTVTITAGASTITPELALGYSASTESRNVTHAIIGRADPDVSLAADTLRKGTLELFFATAESAWDAFSVHSTEGIFVLVDTDIPQANMTYARDGAMRIVLDPQTLRRWLLTVGYQEVAP